jgi:stearoyl-CoA desaturase (delta-9 desaturase)
MQTLTSQQSILKWGKNHRIHHKSSDSDADPYNIRRGFFFAHYGWLLMEKTLECRENGNEKILTYLQNSDENLNPIPIHDGIGNGTGMGLGLKF